MKTSIEWLGKWDGVPLYSRKGESHEFMNLLMQFRNDAKLQGCIDALEEALEMIVNNPSRTWQEHANELSTKLRELKNRAPNK